MQWQSFINLLKSMLFSCPKHRRVVEVSHLLFAHIYLAPLYYRERLDKPLQQNHKNREMIVI